MGETFLASFVIVVLDRLTSDEVLNVASQLDIQPQLNQWTKILRNIRRVLADAELKQFVDTDVKDWLNKLDDLAYDMDDTIDGFVTDHQVGQRPHSQASSSTSQVSFNPFSTSTDLITKIDEISTRLQEIVEEKDDLYLKENNNIVGGNQFPSSTAWERLPSSSLARPHVYGRQKEKKAILKILLNGEAIFGDECVVPIVGMGGVGKTTLAQLLYNDEEVNRFFDLKAWACVGFVSDKFDVLGVTKKILESLTSEACDLKELDTVHVRLREKLLRKKFLVVLDDIWKIECDEWNSLNLPFLAGARGSKIIVTTRSADVAKNMSRIKIRELKQLGDVHSLSLLARHALGRDSFEEHQDLKEIGEKILKKCQGLPLAITTVGGLLRSTKGQHRSQWEHVLHSEVWDLKGPILPALLLSYHYLPSHLKRCFAACAIIPKDREFSKKELILLWMAMGLLRQSREMNCVEDFGAKCFDDLLSRSFFQNSARSRGFSARRESRFVMHHLIIDTAESVAGEICCRWEDMLGNTKISKRARYSSFTYQARDVFENFKDFNSVQRLRTFVSFMCLERYFSPFRLPLPLPDKVLVDLVPKFKFLRVLHLRHFRISELPDNIGEMKHLRHLDLSYTCIKVLPASICTLYNLLTLSVRGCTNLHNLPADIGNLINLRHLDNADTGELKEMPCGIGKLASLQALPKFVVGKGCGLKLRELKDLMLKRSLSIHGLEDVMDSQDADEASLKLKHDLGELELVWKSDDEHHHDEEIEFDVLDKLKPQRNLKKLKINGYRSSKIPSWVGDPSFLELTRISIINCRNCTSLPPLWELPKLKHLYIKDMFELRSIGVQFYNDGHYEVPNPSLKTLCFDGMPEWEEWSICRGCAERRTVFPCLRELTMRKCPKLTRIPLMALPSLSHLVFDNCHGPVLESFSDFTSLCRLSIQNAMGLTCLHDEFLQFCRALEHLDIGSCEKLVSLWPNGFPPQKLVRLKGLRVASCPQLPSLGEEEEHGLPRNLEILTLHDCLNLKLEKLPYGLSNLMSLKRLSISKCPKVESFPLSAVSPMLNTLDIESCGALKSANTSNLDVSIWLMSSLNIESLQNFANLGSLYISNCDGLESFPETEWAPNLRLRVLRIRYCNNFKSLRFNQIQRNLRVSLKELEISGCPKLENFPDGDLPPNLTSLNVTDDCGKLLKPLSEWGLHGLASLDKFSFSHYDYDGDDQQFLLPPTLTRLEIVGLPNLEGLSNGLQNLSSLKKLTIKNCPELRSFPKEEVLSNLSVLKISNCPLLKKRIADERYYQPILASIPLVFGIRKPMTEEHSSAAP